MNKTNDLATRARLVLASGGLAVLVGCTTYVRESQPSQVYTPMPPVEAAPAQVYTPPPAPVFAPPAAPVYVPPQPVQITYVIRDERDFYQPLSQYGRWVNIGEYGQCWVPAQVEQDWRPYTNGHWENTDAGWYWASDEPWGWATYHYGRWDWNSNFGWIWVPQTQWAPAWVSFQEGGGYVGWAPLHPSQRFAGGRIEHLNDRPIAPRSYVFVRDRQFLDPVRPTTVIVNNTTVINKTVNITNIKVVNNTVINEGPRTTIIEKASGRKVHAVPAHDLRRRQEAALLATQPRTISTTATEDQARSERLLNEAKIKAQAEAQKQAREQELQRVQLESARLANEAKAKAQIEAQKKAMEQEKQRAQFEAARLANEAKVKAQLEAQKKAGTEAIKTAQLQIAQNQVKELEMRAAKLEAERRARESKTQIQQTAQRPPSARAYDPALLGRINKLLAIDPAFKQVNAVAGSNNVIHLTGFVKTPELKNRATIMAQKIDGVGGLQNNITVKE